MVKRMGKKTIVVRNPSSKVRKDKTWFYNHFLKKLLDNEKEKVNWVIKVDEKDIPILRARNCSIIELANGEVNNIENQTNKSLIEGFNELYNLLRPGKIPNKTH